MLRLFDRIVTLVFLTTEYASDMFRAINDLVHVGGSLQVVASNGNRPEAGKNGDALALRFTFRD